MDMRENKIFDNESGGIWSGIDSWCNVSMNDIYRNKRGGVRVGKRRAGEEFPHSVVEFNTVHDNYGPGYINNIHNFEDVRLFLLQSVGLSETTGDYESAKFVQNVVCNNRNCHRLGVLGVLENVAN